MINPIEARVRQRLAAEEATEASLEEEIRERTQALVIVRERLEVLRQVIGDDVVVADGGSPASAGAQAKRPAPTPPPPRTAPDVMEQRRDVIAYILEDGPKGPGDMVASVNELLDEKLEYHQVRSVLRKYQGEWFEQDPTRHGHWRLTHRHRDGSANGTAARNGEEGITDASNTDV